MPGFHATVRLLLLVRITSALYSGIADCDETYNYWEPLHLLTHPPSPGQSWQTPFQTWEYAPEYAIRSWAYLSQYLPVASALPRLLGNKDKAAAFYATRIFLAFSSSLCEASLVQAAAETVHPRVARYLLALLLTAAGMYESTTALLPSTFVMYTTTLASSLTLYPTQSAPSTLSPNATLPQGPPHRTLLATVIFALGALLAWPFALVLSFPFVFEELFLPSGVVATRHSYKRLVGHRFSSWLGSVALAALTAIPIVLIDTLAYARLAIVPLNIITYNILSARRGAGPTLYGVEPWYYYLLNLTLNFGPVLFLALGSLPIALLYTCLFKKSSAAATFGGEKSASKGHPRSDLVMSSASTLLAVRLLAVYLWLALLTMQPHKEERFAFAAYPLLCFNGAVCLFCLQETLSELVSRTKSTQNLHSLCRRLSSYFGTAFILGTSAMSLARIYHARQSYHAPFTLLHSLAEQELPRQDASAERGASLRLCYGKEWHRFPSTYLVPAGVDVDFVQSDFRGILPKHFATPLGSSASRVSDGELPPPVPLLDAVLGWAWPWKASTRASRSGFNDLNLEETDRYVDVGQCDYLIDVDYPHAYGARGDKGSVIGSSPDGITSLSDTSSREPRYVRDTLHWTPVHCEPFLDAPASRAPAHAGLIAKARATVERIVWIPAFLRAGTNRYGDYCLLRAKSRRSPT